MFAGMRSFSPFFSLTAEEVARFRARLKDAHSDSGCREWQGCSLPKGYGKLRVRGRDFLAHRMAFFIATGTDPGNLCVLHRCDNPRCCNPEHLFLGTVSENNADMKRKGRQARGERLPQCKFTDSTVAQLRTLEPQLGIPRSRLARHFGISPSHASAILLWKYRTAPTFGQAATNSNEYAIGAGRCPLGRNADLWTSNDAEWRSGSAADS
jgi:hypothetical protein